MGTVRKAAARTPLLNTKSTGHARPDSAGANGRHLRAENLPEQEPTPIDGLIPVTSTLFHHHRPHMPASFVGEQVPREGKRHSIDEIGRRKAYALPERGYRRCVGTSELATAILPEEKSSFKPNATLKQGCLGGDAQ